MIFRHAIFSWKIPNVNLKMPLWLQTHRLFSTDVLMQIVEAFVVLHENHRNTPHTGDLAGHVYAQHPFVPYSSYFSLIHETG